MSVVEERVTLDPESVGHGDNLLTFVGDFQGEAFYVIVPIGMSLYLGAEDLRVELEEWV